MFSVHCDRIDREVLIWTESIIGIQNTDHGVVVVYNCACNETAEMLTGKNAPVEVSRHIAA